jgi:bacterioferritin-associated ferredoxin
MKKFKEILTSSAFNRSMESFSVSGKLNKHELFLRFDTNDLVLDASYTGEANPWLSSLCYIIQGKDLDQLSKLSWKDWEEAFKEDQFFWDLKKEQEDHFFNAPLELLKSLLDIYRGREYLYQEVSPLICRCFGVRESDVLEHLRTHETATLESLAGDTKAGMGCRSCVPQLKRWLVLNEAKKFKHHYKERPIADWLIQIDYQLGRFPKASEWNMQVDGMKGAQVSISFEKDVSQREEELMALELQRFLAPLVDTGLAFFLRRARHFSKA